PSDKQGHHRGPRNMPQLVAIGTYAGHLARPQGDGVGRIGVDRRNAHEKQRRKRYEATAAGYRVDGPREHRSKEEYGDVADVHACRKPMVTGVLEMRVETDPRSRVHDLRPPFPP